MPKQLDIPRTTNPNTDMPRIAIIGGGLTGLITATLLERKFATLNLALHIDIFEKSRSIGRLATRYKKPELIIDEADDNKQWQFDFGAQYFTAKSDGFRSFIQPWVQRDLLIPWQARVAYLSPTDNNQQAEVKKAEGEYSDSSTSSPTQYTGAKEQWNDSQPRYISAPKMTQWGRTLVDELTITNVHYQTRVAPLTHDAYHDNQTTLFSDSGENLGRFDWVICTAPSGQANELMVNTDFAYKQDINKTIMQACYTLMLGWTSTSKLPTVLQQQDWDVLLSKPHSTKNILGKVFVEHHKPKHEHLLPSITIHADNAWSQAHVEDDIDNVRNTLVDAAQHILGWCEDTRPEHIDCHRWRYAATYRQQQGEKLPALIDSNVGLIVTGDWCLEGRIENCFEAARYIVDNIDTPPTLI